VFVDIISVSAVLYIISLIAIKMAPKKLEKKLRKEEKVKKAITIFLVSTIGKLLVFLVNYEHYTTFFFFFIMKRLGKGCLGRFGTHYGYFHYFLWEK
jgi:Na+/melibiose symporter-like transporter